VTKFLAVTGGIVLIVIGGLVAIGVLALLRSTHPVLESSVSLLLAFLVGAHDANTPEEK